MDVYDVNGMLLDIVLFSILIPAMYYDLRKNMIPNFLSVGGIVFGLVVVFLLGEPGQIQGHLFGLVLGFGFFYIMYLFGWVGGGDVKLMGAIGVLKGVTFLVHVIIYTAVIGGLIGVGYLAWYALKKKPLKGLKIPYGTAICLGTFTALAIRYGIITPV
jgi:prepilin peptidase CpaA